MVAQVHPKIDVRDSCYLINNPGTWITDSADDTASNLTMLIAWDIGVYPWMDAH